MRVEEVMTRELVTVAPATTLKQAAPIFLEHRVSGLPVVERGRLVGVFSESDIVAKETVASTRTRSALRRLRICGESTKR